MEEYGITQKSLAYYEMRKEREERRKKREKRRKMYNNIVMWWLIITFIITCVLLFATHNPIWVLVGLYVGSMSLVIPPIDLIVGGGLLDD